ncbi:hypothetical protein [Fuerstiella marisgermanici]|uniref:Uncharacterized protein n=1 Tax=Fuerstiella marisgermanici TaxID=1891926 RepID=A0A1P8WLA4_9PLAN|nr:hypothetical protein [Fuerstiella marisgermanici]APZ94827.1 hypothetical protein Fuma_04476 [Fuerstiella marisgermanici]
MTTPDDSHHSTARPPIDADSIDADWFTVNTIRIAKFDEVFVLSYSKRVMERKTPLPWIAHPTSLDSRGYHATFDEFDGQTAAALYGTFLNLVKLSTLSPPYGALAHSDGEPFKLPYIENRTRIPRELIVQTVVWFLQIGWLEADRTASSCRHDAVMTPARQHHDYVTERDDNGTVRDERETPPARDEPPPLLNLIARWNVLADSGHVPHKANSEPPAKAVLKAWGKAQRILELQTALADIDAIEAAIRGSPFVHAAGWFRLEKLIAGTNKEGTFILTKLLEGGFADQASHQHSHERNPNANRNRLSTAERTEQANADAISGFVGTSDHEAGICQSHNGIVLPETNGIVHAGTTESVVRRAQRIPAADDQPRCD